MGGSMKIDRSSRGKKRKGNREVLVASLVVTVVLLCMVVSGWGQIYQAKETPSVESSPQVVPAGAQVLPAPEKAVVTPVPSPTPMPYPETNGVPVIDQQTFYGYQQLSDPFLVMVNAQVPLPEGWQVTPVLAGEEQIDTRIYRDFMAMVDAAAQENIVLWAASGYRSVETQEIVLGSAVQDNMDQGMSYDDSLTQALRSIAKPGHSEHHTGLTVDINDVNWDFDETPAYAWLSLHAQEYGFVQRYQADKVAITGIDDESWHYRYVGKQNALKMKELGFCLEEYVLYLKNRGVK